MSLVMMDGAMRVDLSRWDEAQRLGICRRCCGPIGGWGTRAPFYVVGTGIDWYHLDELDALECKGAEPTEGQSAQFEGRIRCGGSGSSFIGTWRILAEQVDRWVDTAGQPVAWSAVWRTDGGAVLAGMRGEVAGCLDVAHREKCEPHKMASCAICHTCPERPAS